jgi:hypothetical protein
MADQAKTTRPFAKHALRVFVSVTLGLLLTKAFERVAGPDIAPLVQVQEEARAAVGAFDPWNIIHSYVCNVESGALASDACSPVRERPAGLDPYAAPPPAPSRGLGILVPVAALFAVFWQLLDQPTAIGKFLALFQFAGGFFGVLWASRDERKEAPFWLFGLPLGTIALACVLGWCLQLVMFAGLTLFGEFVKLAGLCCGGSMITYVGWQFGLKWVELKTHETAVKKIVGE